MKCIILFPPLGYLIFFASILKKSFTKTDDMLYDIRVIIKSPSMSETYHRLFTNAIEHA
ncbi:MAG: hypothetical protein FWD38_11600 [Oscillospiraceae bacterium]|nr:hypothetical protein [Oscillospiraceae bacterium]